MSNLILRNERCMHVPSNLCPTRGLLVPRIWLGGCPDFVDMHCFAVDSVLQNHCSICEMPQCCAIHSRPSAMAVNIFGAEQSSKVSIASTYTPSFHCITSNGLSSGWTRTKQCVIDVHFRKRGSHSKIGRHTRNLIHGSI